MIKIKSILDKKNRDDGTRICVMRWIKNFYDYDEWIQELAPSSKLLKLYQEKIIDWFEFKNRYILEMAKENKRILIQKLKERHISGEKITLLCWEKKALFCHRRLLKNLIEQ